MIMKIHGDKVFGAISLNEESITTEVDHHQASATSKLADRQRPQRNYEHKILISILTGIGLTLWIAAIVIRDPKSAIREIFKPFKNK